MRRAPRHLDGESDELDVHNLRGIERCSNLEGLIFAPGIQVTDLSPLRSLKKLSRVILRSVNPLPDVSPLLDLPALNGTTVMRTNNPANDKVVAQRRARGVNYEDA
jgi:hypothetical protein